MFATVYGWSQEYILDQPYTKLRELQNSIRLREYLHDIKTFKLLNLAQGGDAAAVTKLFNLLKPTFKKQTEALPSGAIHHAAMDMSGFVVKQGSSHNT